MKFHCQFSLVIVEFRFPYSLMGVISIDDKDYPTRLSCHTWTICAFALTAEIKFNSGPEDIFLCQRPICPNW